jgi:hypothetical protein
MLKPVMPGLVPGIHVFCSGKKIVDGRDKPGHDKSLSLLEARAGFAASDHPEDDRADEPE